MCAIKAVSRERLTNSPDGPNDLATVSWHKPSLFTFNRGPERAIHIPIIDFCQSKFSLNQNILLKWFVKVNSTRQHVRKAAGFAFFHLVLRTGRTDLHVGRSLYWNMRVFSCFCANTQNLPHPPKLWWELKGKNKRKRSIRRTLQISSPVVMCSYI